MKIKLLTRQIYLKLLELYILILIYIIITKLINLNPKIVI
jgi:hypothetical protein